MNFERWAQQVDLLVRTRVPTVRIERDLDDMYRWTCGQDDIQAHDCGEGSVLLITLDAQTGATVRKISLRDSEPADVAADVVRHFAR